MPLYEYMTDDGRLIEQHKPMAEAEPVGSVCQVPDPDAEGQTVAATRIFSGFRVQGDPWEPYVSERLPRNLEGVPCTPNGKPIVTTKGQERDICAKFGYERE